MAAIRVFSLAFFMFFMLFTPYILCLDRLESSPSPAPQPGHDLVSPTPLVGSPDSPSPSLSSSPSPSPDFLSSPPSHVSPDLGPSFAPSSPSPAPFPGDSSPSPAPMSASDISHADDVSVTDESSNGLSGGQKVGIVVGVIAGACLVGFGGVIYKKRQQNIQRAQYGYEVRREII